MKTKITKILAILSILCLCFLSVFGTMVSFAQSGEVSHAKRLPMSSTFSSGYNISNIEDNGGVYFSGEYFADFLYEIYILGDKWTTSNADIIKAFQEVDEILTRIDSLANTTKVDSDISKFNALSFGQSTPISKETAQMVKIAQEMYDVTGGAFDPSAYRLVDLWGFSSRVQGYEYTPTLAYDRDWQFSSTEGYYIPLPQNKFIQAFKQLCNFQKVVLTGDDTAGYTLTKNCQAVTVDGVAYEQWIDLGGIAKGFAIDLVKDVFEHYGFKNYFVNGATSSMTFTTYPDGAGLEVGLTGYGSISLQNADLSTSGVYVRNYTVDGVTYSHIISPQTGRPVETNILAATAYGDVGGGYVECITTALVVLGRDGVVDFLNTSFCRENNIRVSVAYDCVYEFNPFFGVTVASGKILTNLRSGRFLTLADGFTIVTKVGDDGTVTLDESLADVPDTSLLWWCVGGGVSLLLIALCVVKFVKNRKAQKTEKIQQVKNDKFFKIPDVGIYSLLFLLILILFSVFVFDSIGNTDGIEMVKIVDMENGKTVWSFDTSTGKSFTSESDRLVISVDQDGDTIVVTVTSADAHDDAMNQLTISKVNGVYYVKMTNAICGLHRECVNNFPAIYTNGGTIICTPNKIKVVTTRSEGNYIL